MSTQPTPKARQGTTPNELRERARAKLAGDTAPHHPVTSATSAHRVLLDLAQSPDTAADALALLHELQVHQVELDLQSEDLRNTSAELEVALARQVQLFEHAPAGLLTIDEHTRLVDVNLAAARQLGRGREALLGQRLDGMWPPQAVIGLRAMMADARQGRGTPDGTPGTTLTVSAGASDGSARRLHVCAVLDPAGDQYLLALMDASPDA